MRSDNLRGIGAMVLAVAAFSAMDALLKVLSTYYSPMQVASLRGAASLPFMLLPIALTRRWRDLRPVRFHMHLLRGALTLVVIAGFVYSVRTLSLADAYAIFLSAPLIVTALSVPILGERVGWRRWVAICVGLSGVIVMLRPSASSLFTLGSVAAFVAATAYALNALALRVLTRTDTTASVVFWTVTLLTLFSGLIALPDWRPILAEHWKWIAAIGLFGAIGQHLLTEAFRAAPPSVVAPFEYTALLWGMAIDWIVWSVLPGLRVYIGGGIVIASGLYIIWRERQLQLARRVAEAAAEERRHSAAI
ncbi:MAG: DMT family transporter [Pseudomonadota bacterium]